MYSSPKTWADGPCVTLATNPNHKEHMAALGRKGISTSWAQLCRSSPTPILWLSRWHSRVQRRGQARRASRSAASLWLVENTLVSLTFSNSDFIFWLHPNYAKLKYARCCDRFHNKQGHCFSPNNVQFFWGRGGHGQEWGELLWSSRLPLPPLLRKKRVSQKGWQGHCIESANVAQVT